ncbi:hypothetical protein SMMN14_04867 [Sphaerulina musiva]
MSKQHIGQRHRSSVALRNRQRSAHFDEQRAPAPPPPPEPELPLDFETFLQYSASWSEPAAPTTSTTSTLHRVRTRLRQLFSRDL